MNLIREILNNINELIFGFSQKTFLFRLFTVFLLIFIFFVGMMHWIFFFNFGQMSFKAYDWSEKFMHYSIIQKSIVDHTIPYHTSVTFHGTNRFLAIPQIPISPQIFLLSLMSIGRFALINTLLLYTFGFIGCLLIKKRYRLSFFSFSILYLLFNFNGHITSKIAVGCSDWNGYFLLPFFCLFVLELLERKTLIRTSIKISFVLLAIILQGSFHIYTWCMIFLLLLAIFNREYFKQILLIILFSSLLASFRLLPAIITFWDKGYLIESGYPTISELFNALVTIRQHTYYSLEDLSFRYGILVKGVGGILGLLTWDEYNFFIGVIGLAVITYFGIYLRFSNSPSLKNYKYQTLDMPILILTLFSFSYFYTFIGGLPIPLFNSERVPSRFLVIPMLMLLIISSIRIEQLIHKIKNARLKFLAIAGILQMAFSLATHSYFWRISIVEWHFKDEIADFSINIVRQQDKWYILSLKISAIISIVSFLILGYIFFRSKLRKVVISHKDK